MHHAQSDSGRGAYLLQASPDQDNGLPLGAEEGVGQHPTEQRHEHTHDSEEMPRGGCFLRRNDSQHETGIEQLNDAGNQRCQSNRQHEPVENPAILHFSAMRQRKETMAAHRSLPCHSEMIMTSPQKNMIGTTMVKKLVAARV